MIVNETLDKKTPPFEKVCQTYEGFRARCAVPSEEAGSVSATSSKHGCTKESHEGTTSRCVLCVIPRGEEGESSLRVLLAGSAEFVGANQFATPSPLSLHSG